MICYLAFQRNDGADKTFLTAADNALAAYAAALDLIAPKPRATADTIVIDKWDTERQLMLDFLDIGVVAYSLTDEGSAFADDAADAYHDAVEYAHEVYAIMCDSSPALDAAKGDYDRLKAVYATAMRGTPLPPDGVMLWIAYKDAEDRLHAAIETTQRDAATLRDQRLTDATLDFNASFSAIVDAALAAF